MTLLVERKLPGHPIPRKRLVAEWEDMHHRNLMKGPVASFLFDVHYSVPEKTYQWRIQLDCVNRPGVSGHFTSFESRG